MAITSLENLIDNNLNTDPAITNWPRGYNHMPVDAMDNIGVVRERDLGPVGEDVLDDICKPEYVTENPYPGHWYAHAGEGLDGPDNITGHGSTEQEAIDELMNTLAEDHDHCDDSNCGCHDGCGSECEAVFSRTARFGGLA